jgi:hypothetical protein
VKKSRKDGGAHRLGAEMSMYFEEVRSKPWNSRYFKTPHWFTNYPTMLTQEEMRMLAWLGQTIEAPGAFLDLGSFLGGSTIALALGASRAKTRRTVHAYDSFILNEYLKYTFLYNKGHRFVAGNDGFEVFQKFTKSFSALIEPHRGNIQTMSWPDDDVAILFVDLSKSTEMNAHLLRKYFVALNGGSIVVQQDFLFFRCPWLHTTMYQLRDAMPLLTTTQDSSAVFGVKRQINDEDILRCLTHDGQNDRLHAADYFYDLLPEVRQKEMMTQLKSWIAASPSVTVASKMKPGPGFSEDLFPLYRHVAARGQTDKK